MEGVDIERHFEGDDIAVIAARDGSGQKVAEARAHRGNDAWSIDVRVSPAVADRRSVLSSLIGAALELTQARGGVVHWWANSTGAAERTVAAEHGMHEERQLFQLRRPLPLEPELAAAATGLVCRAFVVGQDEAAWLRVNNRAFADHPEQGGWTRDDLAAREATPWFDPAGFLLHEIDGELAAFCWTKVHADHDPPLGEIYVIAVDPAFHGRGLGRAMTVAGLDSLASRGITLGMLYVDASNVPAVSLYYDLG
ncbi:MAG TPA: mycothiol synthase, partial [Acidimicrobiales bacterium]|nr:mycothiol synthase [Acidimicrobiales bacterium]